MRISEHLEEVRDFSVVDNHARRFKLRLYICDTDFQDGLYVVIALFRFLLSFPLEILEVAISHIGKRFSLDKRVFRTVCAEVRSRVNQNASTMGPAGGVACYTSNVLGRDDLLDRYKSMCHHWNWVNCFS